MRSDENGEVDLARLVFRLLLQFLLVALAGVTLWVAFEFLVRGAS